MAIGACAYDAAGGVDPRRPRTAAASGPSSANVRLRLRRRAHLDVVGDDVALERGSRRRHARRDTVERHRVGSGKDDQIGNGPALLVQQKGLTAGAGREPGDVVREHALEKRRRDRCP